MYPMTMMGASFRRRVAAVAVGLAAIGGATTVNAWYPRWLLASEREVAAEAFAFLGDVQAAQHRHYALHGHFASDWRQLDLRVPPPTRFSLMAIELTADNSSGAGWRLGLNRAKTLLSGRSYTITYSDLGFEPEQSTIASELAPPTTPGGPLTSLAGDPQR